MKNAAFWIEKLRLSEHPEGGYFVQTYRSHEGMHADHLPERYGQSRIFSSAIYYLLESPQFSAFHRLKSDEIWHYYTGSPLRLYIIERDDSLSCLKLGSEPLKDEVFQIVIMAGSWFAATVEIPESYSLIGCTVSPGFEYEDFDLADRTGLIEQYPQYRSVIEKLTR